MLRPVTILQHQRQELTPLINVNTNRPDTFNKIRKSIGDASVQSSRLIFRVI